MKMSEIEKMTRYIERTKISNNDFYQMSLAKPSKEVAAYMEKLGVSLTDNKGKMRSLSSNVNNLSPWRDI